MLEFTPHSEAATGRAAQSYVKALLSVVSNTQQAVVEESLKTLELVIHEAALRISERFCPGHLWKGIRGILESLPLSTGDFATVMNHLNNAKDYFSQHEPGAAQFELRMILRVFSPLETAAS
jgi:hypothetical protein